MAQIRSLLFREMSGKLGSVVLKQTRYGTQMVARPRPTNPDTPAQQKVRGEFRTAAHAWRTLTFEQANEWRFYASKQGSRNDPAPMPYNLFVGLTSRFLAVNPDGVIPVLPPTSPFGGDDVKVELGSAPGKVLVNVQHGNSPGAVTEVMLQPLATVQRATYEGKYRTQGYFALETGQVLELPAKRGAVAVAMRFVRASTGQATGILELGRVVVG